MKKYEHHNPPERKYQKIATLPAANAKEFGRFLKLINSEQPNSPIAIRNSAIHQPLISENFIIDINLKSLIGAKVNMAPLLLEGQINEVVSLLSSGETTVFLDADEGEYVFQNGYRNERLPSFEGNGESPTQPLVFTANDCLGVKVVIEDIKDIRKYIAKSSCSGLIVYNNQLEQVMSFNKSAPYTFKKAGGGNLKYEQYEMLLLSFNFLRFSDKDTTIQLAAIDDRGFWLITEVKMTSKSTITTYELLAEHNA